jgi:hypothetical protein
MRLHQQPLDTAARRSWARIAEVTEDNNTCDRCGKTEPGIGWFAKRYRSAAMNKWNLPDPGNLCGSCAAKNDSEFKHSQQDSH